MGACANRDLLYVCGSGTATRPDHLPELGWRVRHAPDPRGLLKLVQQRDGQPLAALLDLRYGFSEPRLAAIGPALAASNVGWVAAVAPDQLDLAPIRRLISEYCYDYVTLPCPGALLDSVIGHAHGMARLACETRQRVAGTGLEGIVGESAAMRALAKALCKAASTDAPVFIAGETGTGKELAAMALHRHSRRAGLPFVAINCGAIPQNLVQSELFGYERGAFTGAQQRKLGRIELAHRGTLFLDEIGDLPMESQAALLRFLQEGTFERLGGHDPVRVDVRIVSATHHDLQDAMSKGRFRADLYHRLCVIRLDQPPLRERGSDIDLLAAHALASHAGEGGHMIRGFAPCARAGMHAYPWPGNVRELINRVREAVVMCDNSLITAADLRIDAGIDVVRPTLEDARLDATRHAVESALQRNRGRVADTARELDISRVTLYRIMQRFDMHANDPSSLRPVSQPARRSDRRGNERRANPQRTRALQ